MSLGRPHVHLRSVGSTNTLAHDLAARGAPHGTLVSADAQTAGHGRQGRVWSTAPGTALLCSWVIRDPPRLLSFAAGVAVAELCGEQALLKWPNDVLIDGRKVAGILVEGRPQERWAVLGIGVNVAVELEQLPEELRGRAGTLGLGTAAIAPMRGRLGGLLERWLPMPDRGLLEAVRARDALRGHTVTWDRGSGTAAGIDDSGRLLVTLVDDSVQALEAGEVHLGMPLRGEDVSRP